MGDTVAMVEHYQSLFAEALALDSDGATVLVVRGASVQEVVDALGGVPPGDVPEHEWDGEDPIWAAYSLVAIEGGVLATEDTGYADPPRSVLVTLSEGGRAAAVVRDNIQAHCRFGAARDGELVFDEHEYAFFGERDSVPQEIRELFDLAWVDPDDEDSDPAEEDSVAVGLAMVEVVTGIRLTPADAASLEDDDVTVVAVRQLQYANEL